MEEMDQDLYYFAFSNFLGIGPNKLARLILEFEDVEKTYYAPKESLGKILGEPLAQKFLVFRESFEIKKEYKKVKEKGIVIISLASSDYPQYLREISDPPICIYLKGNKELLCFSDRIFFAIVGTRKPSGYGRKIAYSFAKDLGKKGIIIVSGLAVGIDAAAHKGCLDAGGKTIAVLGCGVDIVYPALNRDLYRKILEKGGAIISEFPPGTLVKKGLFIARNRIISALSKGVLVVEGSENSGSLITARYAAEQGKDVFAIPGRIDEENSRAPHILIKQGARLTECVEDILQEYLPDIASSEENTVDLTEEEKAVLKAFDGVEVDIEVLRKNTNFRITKLLSILSILEIKGVVRSESGKFILSKI